MIRNYPSRNILLRALRRLGPALRREAAALITRRIDAQFHAGERAAQILSGEAPGAAAIRERMPDGHRLFFEGLPFVVAAAADDAGWPNATILAGPPGFVASPDPKTLHIAIAAGADDPAVRCFSRGAAIGLLGIDLATRRRNRANGVIAAASKSAMIVTVRESFGNCPKYVHIRDIEALSVVPQAPELMDRLDQSARGAIAASDTLFVATSGGAHGVDISHRGGRPGFVGIDGDTLTIPDFAGNSYFNTLGNILLNPRAALLFPDFGGDLLLVQGWVEIRWEVPENERLAGAKRLWRMKVCKAWRRRGALPLRWVLRAPLSEVIATGSC